MKYVEKIIEYALYLMVVVFPWQTRLILRSGEINGGYNEYATISLYGSDILFILITLLFFGQKIWLKKKSALCKNNNKDLGLWMILALLELSFIISFFIAPDFLLALQKYYWFLRTVGIFFLLSRLSLNNKKLILFFIGGAFVESIFASAQFFSQSSLFASKWLGLASHFPFELGHSVIETAAGGRWLRAYGSFDHPNILGGYFALTIIIYLLFYLQAQNRFTPNSKIITAPSFNKKNIKKILFYLANLFVLLYLVLGLFFSFSRSAWLSMFLPLFIMLVLMRERIKKLVLLKNILFIIIIFSILSFTHYELFQARVFGQGRLEKKSNIERIASIQEGWDIWTNKEFFGVGAGNYVKIMEIKNPGLAAWDYQPSHNVFLLILIELGIFGFSAFILLFFELFRLTRKGGAENHLGRVYLVPVLGIIIIFCFDHYFYTLSAGYYILAFSLGISYRLIFTAGDKV